MAIFGRMLGPKAPPPPPEKTAEQIAAESAAAAAASTPKGVTREELDSILGERFERVMEQVAQIAGRPVQVIPSVVQPRVTEPELSDAEIEQAILQGQGSASTIRRLVTTEATKLARALITEHIDPLRQTGLGAISGLVNQHAAATLPFYRKFQAQIDAQVSQLTPDQQVNPQAIKLIHDAVVGANWNLVADEVLEQRTRQAAEASSGGSLPGGSAARTASTRAAGPDMDDFGGKAALRALEFKDGGTQDLDTFARKLGYKSFEEYAAIMPALDAQYRR